SYLDGPLQAAIEKARARGPSEKAWRPSLTGGWLTSLMTEGGKSAPSPRPWRIAGEPRANVVDAFLATVERVRAAMLQVDRHDLGVGFASPVSPLIRLNIGDALRLLVVSSHRPLAPAERTPRPVRL